MRLCESLIHPRAPCLNGPIICEQVVRIGGPNTTKELVPLTSDSSVITREDSYVVDVAVGGTDEDFSNREIVVGRISTDKSGQKDTGETCKVNNVKSGKRKIPDEESHSLNEVSKQRRKIVNIEEDKAGQEETENESDNDDEEDAEEVEEIQVIDAEEVNKTSVSKVVDRSDMKDRGCVGTTEEEQTESLPDTNDKEGDAVFIAVKCVDSDNGRSERHEDVQSRNGDDIIAVQKIVIEEGSASKAAKGEEGNVDEMEDIGSNDSELEEDVRSIDETTEKEDVSSDEVNHLSAVFKLTHYACSLGSNFNMYVSLLFHYFCCCCSS